MSYVENNLVDGEKIIYEAKVSGIILVWPVIFLAACLFLDVAFIGTAISSDMMSYSGGVFATIGALTFVCLFFFLKRFITIKTTEYAITDKRIISKRGWLSDKTFDISLKKCDGVTYNRSVMGKIFNYADVALSSTGTRLMVFKSVSNPEEFKNQVRSAIELY